MKEVRESVVPTLTKADAARRVGVRAETVGRWERGSHLSNTPAKLGKLLAYGRLVGADLREFTMGLTAPPDHTTREVPTFHELQLDYTLLARELAKELHRLGKGNGVARKTVLISDLSGDAIEDGKGAKVRITYQDARKGSAELDVTAEEADELARRGRRTARRGRRPAGQS